MRYPQSCFWSFASEQALLDCCLIFFYFLLREIFLFSGGTPPTLSLIHI